MIETVTFKSRTDWQRVWRTFFSFVFTRGFIVGVLLLGEIGLLLALLNNLFDTNTAGVYVGALTFSIAVVVYLVSQKTPTAFKLAWAAFILVTPPTGAIIYLLYEVMGRISRRHSSRAFLQQVLSENLQQDPKTWRRVYELPAGASATIRYLAQFENYPVYEHTRTHYYPLGELFFEQFKKDLQAAKKFIFLEYYIVTPGKMWHETLAILQQKVREGVEVRMMYDDFGSLFSLPTNYTQTLAQMGIKTVVLNRFRPLIAFQMNNRDHRKIAVIDGKVGYTGGLNLADEYINAIVRYGHWKDTAIRLEGEAVNSLTLIFLQMWNSAKISDRQIAPYLITPEKKGRNDGLVLPFADDPMDHEHVGRNVYLGLVQKATKYVYLTTPYLVPDDELVTALTLAAKSGVDVRVIIPALGDHWYVHMLSHAFCLPLIEAGCQVYEYSPGFMHSKTMLVDGNQAVVGSINLDYRSLYLLYESAVYTYGSQAVEQLEEDFVKTLSQCRLIELADVTEIKWTTRIARSLLRLIAPLV